MKAAYKVGDKVQFTFDDRAGVRRDEALSVTHVTRMSDGRQRLRFDRPGVSDGDREDCPVIELVAPDDLQDP